MDTVTDIISARKRQPDGFSRLIAGSAFAHVVCLGVLLVAPTPSAEEDPTVVMMVSMPGTEGPETGGLTPMGDRPIEAPPPDEPLPTREIEAPPPTAAPAMTTPAPPEAPRRRTPPPPPQPQPRRPTDPNPRRVPFSPDEPRPGSTPRETGTRSTNSGLSTGGGGGGDGVVLDVVDFCCMEYIQTMKDLISRHWDDKHGVYGSTVIKFTIHRDGRIDAISRARSSSHWALDNAAERAVRLTERLPPLPARHLPPTLTVQLTFEYGP